MHILLNLTMVFLCLFLSHFFNKSKLILNILTKNFVFKPKYSCKIFTPLNLLLKIISESENKYQMSLVVLFIYPEYKILVFRVHFVCFSRTFLITKFNKFSNLKILYLDHNIPIRFIYHQICYQKFY